MKRLTDETEAGDELNARLTALLASAQPPAHDAFRKRRIRVAIESRVQGTRGRKRPLRTLAIVFTLVGTAAAMSGLLLAPEPETPVAPSVQAPPHDPVAKPSRGEPSTQGAAPVVTPPETPEVAPLVASEASAPVAKPRVAARAAKPSASEGEDPTQVVEAVRALRKQRDPKRAQALLDGYLSKNPDGALSEEALALSMEAAASSKSPKAADYARRYLERFPQGRHAAFARKLAGR